MTTRYQPVGWNRNKYIYDAFLLVGIAAYILIFVRLAPTFDAGARPLDPATVRMRAFGTCAFLMLTAILCIGPLARLDRRFLPLLYNRRHFGVMACAVAVAHAMAVLDWYYAFSPVDPYVALLSMNPSFGRVAGFPFELLGAFALAVLLVLAATSHDFWLAFLTPPVWKAIHMAVYAAYAAVVLHVALGALQDEPAPLLAAVVASGAAAVVGLHLVAGLRERRYDHHAAADDDGWIFAATVDAIADGHGIAMAVAGGERIAVVRYDGKLSALSNLCAHQNGPLGEGRVLDGCITCPWHGFQYRCADGCAPPPFTEKVATFRLKLDGPRILVDPRANPPGTFVEPVAIPEGL
jgi:nitrite reductase/ring-hydroxylating ferredoxin subunit/DMSO/TMAO reductase YedYZ heme-binding membrane subunit